MKRSYTTVIFLATAAYCIHGNNDHERTKLDEGKLWQRSTHAMASIQVNNAAVGSLLAPLLAYKFLLPSIHLRAGLAYIGSRSRLRRFVRDLLVGRKHLKIGAVGGSVTWGQGASNYTKYAWFSVVSQWLITSFPNANITARNGAVPATPSSYMVMCLDASVDPDVDLVFVEYQLNDGIDDAVLDNDVVRTMERLVRRLLDFPGKPAVVLMQVPSHGVTFEPSTRPFHHTMEDLEGALCQYYDVQYLSLRTALYRLAEVERAEGFRWKQLFVDHHPGDAGNHVMADLVAALLQDTALDLMLEPYSVADEKAIRELPKPMYEGNLPPSSPMCLLGEHFRAIIVTKTGFIYLNEGQVTKPRLGYVATEPGAQLTFQVDTQRPIRPAGESVALYVQHLKSYQHMGCAEISCISGCSCQPVQVDAHIKEYWSQTYQVKLLVTQSANCTVAVTVMNKTSSGEHKFKVSGIVIAESPDAASYLDQVAGPEGHIADSVVPADDQPIKDTRGRRQLRELGTVVGEWWGALRRRLWGAAGVREEAW